MTAQMNLFKNSVQAKHVVITPDIALKLLKSNTRNRIVTQAKVDSYAKQMREGLWAFNGETLIVDSNGVLANGQHRLLACIKSGTSFETIVVTGVLPEAFATIDTGRNRKGSDVLSIAGYKNTSSLSAAVRSFLWGLDGRRRDTITNGELLETAAEHPEISLWSNRYASKKPNIMGGAIAGVLALIHIFHGETAAQSFFSKAVLGEMLHPKDPEYLLRQIILSHRVGKQLANDYRIAITVKAANYAVQGKQVSRLQILDNEKLVFWRGK